MSEGSREHTPIPPTPPSHPPATVVIGPTGLPAAIIEGAKTVSVWSPQQVVTVGAVVSMLVTNGLLIWILVDSRGDRKDEREDMSRRNEAMIRSLEDGRERDRQFVAIERDKDRKNAMELQKVGLDHCVKLGQYVQMLAVEVGKLIKMPKTPDESDLYPTIAPPPRLKLNGGSQADPSGDSGTGRLSNSNQAIIYSNVPIWSSGFARYPPFTSPLYSKRSSVVGR